MKSMFRLVAICAACATALSCNPPPQAPPVVPTSAAPAGAIDTSGSFKKGFDYSEAAKLLEFCDDINGPDDIPDTGGWTPIWPTKNLAPLPFGRWQNTWRLWKKNDADKTFAIVIRGTVESEPSIAEDVIATSISARPAVQAWSDGYLTFTLATTPRAETHLGFTYALALLMFAKDHGILEELKAHVPTGSKIYITGHSQGAAVAALVHAFLHYAINDPDDRYGLRNSGYSLKSYFYAQPKPGNWQFAMDFARIASSHGTSFVINNSRDWVTQVPLTLEFLDEP